MGIEPAVLSIERHLSNGNASTAFSELEKELSRSDHFAIAVADSPTIVSSCMYILTHLFIDPPLSSTCIKVLTLLAGQNPEALRPFLTARAFDALAEILRVSLNQPDPVARQFFDPVFNLIRKIVPAASRFEIIGAKSSHWLFFLELLRKSKGEKRGHVIQMLEQISGCPVEADQARFLEKLVESLAIGNGLTLMRRLTRILHEQVVLLCARPCYESIPTTVTTACLVTLMTVDSVEIAILLVKTVGELCEAQLHRDVVAKCEDVDFDRILCNISDEKLERDLVNLMRAVRSKTVVDESFAAKVEAIERRVQKRNEGRKSSDKPPRMESGGEFSKAFSGLP